MSVTIPQYEIVPYDYLLSAEQKAYLKSKTTYTSYGNKDVVYKQNTRTSHVFFVKQGVIKVFKEARNERSYILKLACAGEYIGLMSVFAGDIYQSSASAINFCEIGMIDIVAFNEVIKQNGDFALQFMALVSQEGLFVFEKLMNQVHKQLPGRIADLILYFSDHIYKVTKFEFPLTRKELAELCGTTKESFIRTLTEFKNDKIIEIDGSKIEIKSMDIIRTLKELG
jgi:CRP/FNR family transcriptional regulator, polysaccharide utilization system transcription regulator